MEWIFKATEQITPLAEYGWDRLVALANSNFMAALAGALAGAIAADRIATRKAKGTKIEDAMRNTNAAISLAALIANEALKMKGQHALDLHRDYVLEEIRMADTERRHQAGEVLRPEDFVLRANLVDLPELYVPIDALTTTVFEKLKVGVRPTWLLVAVQTALRDLNLSIKRRNELCSQFRSIPREAQAALYLGLPTAAGRDETYPQTIFHIYQITNNLAFFAAQLASDLHKHGEKVSDQFAKFFRTAPPVVNELVDTPRSRELMPPAAAYTEFLSMFHDVGPPKPVGLWKRLLGRFQASRAFKAALALRDWTRFYETKPS
jgi:hypothetical protein